MNDTIVTETQDSYNKLIERIKICNISKAITNTWQGNLKVGNYGSIEETLRDNDMYDKNNILISFSILINMGHDTELKEHIMSQIEEFLDSKEQSEIASLDPSVKSAGMIIFPNGDIVYWIEGYTQVYGKKKIKKMEVSDNYLDCVIKYKIKTLDDSNDKK